MLLRWDRRNDGGETGTVNNAPAASLGSERSAAFQELSLSSADFRAIATRVRELTGIVLGESKRDLVYGRLGRRLRALGLSTFTDYVAHLNGPDAAAEQVMLVNAITTNLTGFFRESHHFDVLAKDVLSELAHSNKRRLRIWSAGCSSGEEPYTIAMTAHREIAQISTWDALILATDIDTNMLASCQAGRYEIAKAAPIPQALQRSFVRQIDDQTIEMADSLKAMIRFRRLNLLGPWPMRGPFDAIFCRNVVIYFDKDTQRILFDRFADLLPPGGWLFVGHSETLFNVCDRFQHLGRTVYRKVK